MSRTITALAADAPRALAAIAAARASARARGWELAGEHAPDHDITAVAPLVIDLDATLVTAHSDKARPCHVAEGGMPSHAAQGLGVIASTRPDHDCGIAPRPWPVSGFQYSAQPLSTAESRVRCAMTAAASWRSHRRSANQSR